jgi:dihydroneopterin aldolase
VITIELHGLRLFGRHGVYPQEREEGQDFIFDVELDVGERGVSDQLDDAVDYDAVAKTVQEVSDARAYNLLEALSAAVADELVRRFSAERAVVRVTKPAVRPGGVGGFAAVRISRP